LNVKSHGLSLLVICDKLAQQSINAHKSHYEGYKHCQGERDKDAKRYITKYMLFDEQQLPIEFDFFRIIIIELKQDNDLNNQYERNSETYQVDDRVEILRLLQFLQTFLFMLCFYWLNLLLCRADHGLRSECASINPNLFVGSIRFFRFS
jgi:hypothetical protein